MKRLVFSAMLGAAMVASAAAQTGGSGSTSGTSNTGGTSSDQSTAGSTSSGGYGSQGSMSGTQSTSSTSDTSDKHAGKTAKMTGCVQSQGSGYALVDKKHPNGVTLLSSQDLSAHVGHKVEVKGTWESASAAANTGASSASTGATGTESASAGTSGTAGQTGTSGAGTGSSSASSLPQSDQAAAGGGEALRVTDIKMKSDKCETASNNTSSPK